MTSIQKNVLNKVVATSECYRVLEARAVDECFARRRREAQDMDNHRFGSLLQIPQSEKAVKPLKTQVVFPGK